MKMTGLTLVARPTYCTKGSLLTCCQRPSDVSLGRRPAASAGGQNRQHAQPGPAASFNSLGSSWSHLPAHMSFTT